MNYNTSNDKNFKCDKIKGIYISHLPKLDMGKELLVFHISQSFIAFFDRRLANSNLKNLSV
jgi:hypothetical protein